MQKTAEKSRARLSETIGSKHFVIRVFIKKGDFFAQLEVKQHNDEISYSVNHRGAYTRGTSRTITDAFNDVTKNSDGWTLLTDTCSVGLKDHVYLDHTKELTQLAKNAWKEQFAERTWKEQFAERILECSPSEKQTEVFEKFVQRITKLRDYRSVIWLKWGQEYRYVELYYSKSNDGSLGTYSSIIVRESPHNRQYYYIFQSESLLSCLHAMLSLTCAGEFVFGTNQVKKSAQGECLQSELGVDDDMYRLTCEMWAAVGDVQAPVVDLEPQQLQQQLWKEKLRQDQRSSYSPLRDTLNTVGYFALLFVMFGLGLSGFSLCKALEKHREWGFTQFSECWSVAAGLVLGFLVLLVTLKLVLFLVDTCERLIKFVMNFPTDLRFAFRGATRPIRDKWKELIEAGKSAE